MEGAQVLTTLVYNKFGTPVAVADRPGGGVKSE